MTLSTQQQRTLFIYAVIPFLNFTFNSQLSIDPAHLEMNKIEAQEKECLSKKLVPSEISKHLRKIVILSYRYKVAES